MPQQPNTNHLQPHPPGFMRPYLGGSLPNVNQIAANPHIGFYASVRTALVLPLYLCSLYFFNILQFYGIITEKFKHNLFKVVPIYHIH